MSAALPNPFIYGILAALQRPTVGPIDEQYLYSILGREAVEAGIFSPAYRVQGILRPALTEWAHRYLIQIAPSGSFAKGTANRSGTDVDLFISVSEDTPDSLESIYNTLSNQMKQRGYLPRHQNVSIGISVGGLKVDLVPARRQNWLSADHSLYHRKSKSWRKTNIAEHVKLVANSGRQAEIRLLKLWRDQRGIEFPSFYLELAVIEALRTRWEVNIASCMLHTLDYLATNFVNARFVDPANSNNVISDDLSAQEKARIQHHARLSLAQPWRDFVR
jgi:tRNA nucleotidyltransferase (CCA-adding enzyme)